MEKFIKYRELALLLLVALLLVAFTNTETEINTMTEEKEILYDTELIELSEYFVKAPVLAIEVEHGFVFINMEEEFFVSDEELEDKEFFVEDGQTYQVELGRYTTEVYSIYQKDFEWVEGVPEWTIISNQEL